MVGFRGNFLEIPPIFICQGGACSHRAEGHSWLLAFGSSLLAV
jgi:hypothetical protein